MEKPAYCQRGHRNKWYTAEKAGFRRCTECQRLITQKKRLLIRIEKLSQELIWDREFFERGEYEYIDRGNNPQGSELHGEYLIQDKEKWINDIANELEEICILLESPIEQRKLTQQFYDSLIAESALADFAPEPDKSGDAERDDK